MILKTENLPYAVEPNHWILVVGFLFIVVIAILSFFIKREQKKFREWDENLKN